MYIYMHEHIQACARTHTENPINTFCSERDRAQGIVPAEQCSTTKMHPNPSPVFFLIITFLKEEEIQLEVGS